MRHSRPPFTVLAVTLTRRLSGLIPAATPPSPGRWAHPAHSPAIRTLRLVMVAGSAGAGLCLVLAMIALVVAFGGAKVSPTASTKRTQDTSASLNRTSQRPSPRAWPKVPGSTIADYRGGGSSRRDIFHLDEPGVWGLSWRFSCRVGQGRFMVRETDPNGRQAIEIRSSGAAGQGISWATGNAGRHSLVITSGCSWTAKIVLPRPPPGKR